MCKSCLQSHDMTACRLPGNRLAFAILATMAFTLSTQVIAADPPKQIHITREGTITTKQAGQMNLRFKAELTLRPTAATGALEGEGTFHCTMQDTGEGFVLEANHKFTARGTWKDGRVQISGPERLTYVCKKSHFDPANPGPNPEGAWKPGDTGDFELSPELYRFEGAVVDGSKTPSVQTYERNNAAWRIETRIAAKAPGDDTSPGDASPGGNTLWKSEPQWADFTIIDGSNYYRLKYQFEVAMAADGGLMVRAFDLQKDNRDLSDVDVPLDSGDDGNSDPYPTPIGYEWTRLQVEPLVQVVTVEQPKDAQGKVWYTHVGLLVRGTKATGVAKKLGTVDLGDASCAESWLLKPVEVDHYGPDFETSVEKAPDTRIELNSKHVGYGPAPEGIFIPAMDKLAPGAFRVTETVGAVYPGPDDDPPALAQKSDDEFPPRTYLKSNSGPVEVKRANGSWFEGRPNMDLHVGDTVKTTSHSKAEVVLAGSAIVRIKPGTEFIIPREGNSSKKIGFIKMVKGFFWARAKKERNSLKIATPNAIAGGSIKGEQPGGAYTEYRITVGAKSSKADRESVTCVHCYAGKVEVEPLESEKGGRTEPYLLSPDDTPTICLPLRTPLTVRVRVGDERSDAAAGGVTIVARKKGASLRDAVRDWTARDGRVTLTLPEVKKDGVEYEIVARSDQYGVAAKTVTVSPDRANEVTLVLKKSSDTTTAEPKQPSFSPCNRPGRIHCTRVVNMSDQRSGSRRQGTGTFTAEIWAEEKSSGSLTGTCSYYYKKEDSTGSGGVEGKLADQPVTGTINNEHVVIEGPADMEVTGYGNRRTREPVVIFDFMNKFEGTLVDNVFVGPSESHDKYSVTYTVEKTQIERCAEDDEDDDTDVTPVSGSFAGDWSVVLYPTSEPSGNPGNPQRWRIVVSGSQARAKDPAGNLVRGPLSEGGRVWNPDCVHPMGTIVMRFRDLSLTPDGNQFVGEWGGPPPHPTPEEPNPSDKTFHGNAVVGTRVGSKPQIDDTANDTPDVTADTAPAREVTVELKSGAERLTCEVATGGTVVVKVADYGATGYGPPKLISADSRLALRSTTTEAMRRVPPGGRPLEGAGRWQIYRFQAGSQPGTGRLVFEKRRSWNNERLEYALEVTVK